MISRSAFQTTVPMKTNSGLATTRSSGPLSSLISSRDNDGSAALKEGTPRQCNMTASRPVRRFKKP